MSNNIYSQDTFNTNGTNILLNYRQWDNVPQCIQTVRYVICNHGYIYDTDYVYNTSDVDDENQAYQMYLGAPPAGTDRSLKIINETRVYPISGFGNCMNNDTSIKIKQEEITMRVLSQKYSWKIVIVLGVLLTLYSLYMQ